MKRFKTPSARNVMLGLLLVPVVASTIYYSLVAQDRFASTTVVTVTDTSAGGSGGAAGLLAAMGGGVASHSDALYLESYIQSMDLLLKLDSQFDLKAHYSSPKWDVFYRLPANVGREEFLNYFRSRVRLTMDDFSGLLTVEVQAFDSAFAQKLAQAIISESEKFINENSHRISREKMAFAESEVERAVGRIKKARSDVVEFQTKNKLMDPMSQAAASSSLTASLQAAQAKQEADLKAAQAYMSEDSLQVRSLRSQLEATKAQMEVEKLRATAATQGNMLPALTVEFQRLMVQAGYADDAYKASLMAYEQARIDAARKLKTVVVMEPPTMPDLPQYPRRLIDWLTALAISGMAFTIIRLIYATIREHQD